MTRVCVCVCVCVEACKSQPDSGPCFGMLQRYHYNSSIMACQMFTYGGCMGNQNNFVTEKECLQSCRTEGECVCVCGQWPALNASVCGVVLLHTLYLVPQPPAGCPWTLVPVKCSQTCGPSTQPRGSVCPSNMEAARATAINSIARRSVRSTAALWWEMVGTHTLHQKIAWFFH